MRIVFLKIVLLRLPAVQQSGTVFHSSQPRVGSLAERPFKETFESLLGAKRVHNGIMPSSARAYRVLSWLKILLLVFTVFFLISGVVFLATGIYAWMALKHYTDLSPDISIGMTPAVLCGIGGVVIISGLFGFLSAFKNNQCMTNCYCMLIGLVFITELAGGIAAIVFMNSIRDSFTKGFNEAIVAYNPGVQNAIDKAQLELGCCGSHGYEDWFSTVVLSRQCKQNPVSNTSTVPPSCCKTTTSKNKTIEVGQVCFCGLESELQFVNQKGCISVLFGNKGQTLHYLIAVAFGMAAMQVIGILISLCIYRKLREIKITRIRY